MTHPHLQHAINAIECERAGLGDIIQQLNNDFAQACDQILSTTGRCLVLGVGKSGHIARKIASTLASTGTPAFYVHPTEASHGDMGMITANDVVIAISYSGETAELITLMPLIQRIGSKIIAITGKLSSSLALASDHVLNAHVSKEACPLGLAPTSSTTATLALGDALAVALLSAREFSSDDFAIRHPGGSLGKRLLLTARDIMRHGDAIPIVSPETVITEALVEITSKHIGATVVLNKNNALMGLFTDGDLRRCLDSKIDLFTTPIQEVMTHSPRSSSADVLASEIMHTMQTHKINQMLITENDQLIGIMHLHDLLAAGVSA